MDVTMRKAIGKRSRQSQFKSVKQLDEWQQKQEHFMTPFFKIRATLNTFLIPFILFCGSIAL